LGDEPRANVCVGPKISEGPPPLLKTKDEVARHLHRFVASNAR